MKLRYPKITRGKHTTFLQHRDGHIDMITDWDALGAEINKAIDDWKKGKVSTATTKGKRRGR